MAQGSWEADKMLDVYIHDYLTKRNLHNTAKSFQTEGKVSAEPVAIDAPGGFLFEWWSVFWDIFIARTNEKHSEAAAAYIEAQQIKAREHQQQLQMQQLQIIQQRQAQLRRDTSHQSLGGSLNGINSEGLLGPSTASVYAAKLYEERMKIPHSMESESSQPFDASRIALLKSAAGHPGGLVPGNAGSVSGGLPQMQDIKSEVNLGMAQRTSPIEPYGQGLMQQKPGLNAAGLNQGVGSLPLKGWPLTGIDQLRPSIGPQGQKPFLPSQNQFQLLTPQQQQQLLAQAHIQGSLGSNTNFGDMDSQRFRLLQRSSLSGVDGQSPGNEMAMKMAVQMQHSSSQPSQDQLQQQQQQQLLQQNSRKRKPTSSGAANSTGTGNTVGPSTSPPSTPSTHTPGDGGPLSNNLQHMSSMPKSLMMYGPDGGATLASSSNQLDGMDHFADVGSLDDHVESFLSHDDGDGRDIFAALKRSPVEHSTESTKGLTFNEVSCIRASNNKVVCCHFSSDGKLLASGGHDKKVIIWNSDTLQTESSPEEHTLPITDIRFRPNSSQLLSSSFDRTVRLWNASDPHFSLHTFTGHSSPVKSVDFHPKKTDLFCSCDKNGEMRFWNTSTCSLSRVSKGASGKVRFQPRHGQFLAASSEKLVSIFDIEVDRQIRTLSGHTKEISSISWDANGELLASACQDSVKVWSASGECIHEFNSSGNQFHSCVFHPSYPNLLIIGGYQSLELWNMTQNKSMTVNAHDNLIAGLAQSPVTAMVASASYDKTVKLWK